jgi:hypothetical protein
VHIQDFIDILYNRDKTKINGKFIIVMGTSTSKYDALGRSNNEQQNKERNDMT